MRGITVRRVAPAAALALTLGAAGCGSGDDGSAASSRSGGGAKIALLLPENKTTRYEAHDRPGFQRELRNACPDCEFLYYNAGQDAARQQQQVEAAITEGAKVLVISAVDVQSAPALVRPAKQAGIPVIAYERMIPAEVDYYLSYDNCRVGELQAQALVDRLKADGNATGRIVKINGSPTDSNALEFKRCSSQVFKEAGVQVAREYDTPDWSPDKAQQEMDQAIAAVGCDGFKGVYAANDGTAGGAIAALSASGVDTRDVPVTGQDAELAAVQRVLDGRQFMTIYKAIAPESARRGGASARRSSTAGHRQPQGRQRRGAGALDGVRPDRRHARQRRRHRGQGRLLEGRRPVLWALRRRMQGGGRPMTAGGPVSSSSAAP
jgi:D-xylose transport system substrate-binding protein